MKRAIIDREFCARDRTRLINAVQVMTGRKFAKPVDALRTCIEVLGYDIQVCSLAPGQGSLIDPASRLVWLCSGIVTGAALSKSGRAELAYNLAKALAYVRLHQHEIVQGSFTAEHEAEAELYARAYLVPRRLLGLGRELTVSEMANWLVVPDLLLLEELVEIGARGA